MDVDTNEKILVIDLCTPNVDIKNEANTLTPKPLIERFPNLGNRLPVLPCYPTNDKYAHGDPLLPNISRMYIEDRLSLFCFSENYSTSIDTN
jgi:hypothetical protein